MFAMLMSKSCFAVVLLAVPAHALCAAPALSPTVLHDRVAAVTSRLALPSESAERVHQYVQLLLAYNERTNVYSKSAYDKLPFHIEDSVTLALLVGKQARRGALDLGSGSGLPSLVIACVNPDLPVWAVESKSRKTRFLAHAAKTIGLADYMPLTRAPPARSLRYTLPRITLMLAGPGLVTENVNELSREWAFDCDVVTAKAFKPLNEVGPIARRCVHERAQLLVPISEAQTREYVASPSELPAMRGLPAMRCPPFAARQLPFSPALLASYSHGVGGRVLRRSGLRLVRSSSADTASSSITQRLSQPRTAPIRGR